MLTPNTYDIEVIVKEVPVKEGADPEPRVFFRCKCGNQNMEIRKGDHPEPFYDYLKQVNVTPDPVKYPHRTRLIKYKAVVCRKCNNDIPHNVVGVEVKRQMIILDAKKKKQ